MWGQICSESILQTNFNFGFSTHKSDILLHLSQWQYWWWFWFSFFWTFYYFVMLRVIKQRVFKMNPKINTSLRSRGKWGDFLIALLPLSWCASILLNSTFILRMIEWQNEANLLTIRIHGKQWYWVYKFDIKDLNSIWNAPKNIGRNRWVIHSSDSLIVSDFYLQSVHIRSKQVWLKNYWNSVFSKNVQTNSTLELSFSENLNKNNNKNFYYEAEAIDDTWDVKTNARVSRNTGPFRIIKPVITNYNFRKISEIISYRFFDSNNKIIQKPDSADSNFLVIKQKRYKKKQKIVPMDSKQYDKVKEEAWYTYQTDYYLKQALRDRVVFNALDFWKKNPAFRKILSAYYKNSGDVLADKFKKNPIALYYGYANEVIQKNLFKVNFYELSLKRLGEGFIREMLRNSGYREYAIIKAPYICSRTLLENQISDNLIYVDLTLKQKKIFSTYDFYKLARGNRKFSETYPVTLSRRLLRTKKTLILPVHVNIGVVTNSYDVVHSWFVPGLGLKMDCVPGRSTHHSLYLDNIGFYYGQCAEICGRYHHHMPIKLCGLPFEHFVVWWQTKGLPKIIKTNDQTAKYKYIF